MKILRLPSRIKATIILILIIIYAGIFYSSFNLFKNDAVLIGIIISSAGGLLFGISPGIIISFSIFILNIIILFYIIPSGLIISEYPFNLTAVNFIAAILAGFIYKLDNKLIQNSQELISEQNRIRTEVKERILAEEHFKALAENSLDVIMRFDKNYRHLYVNKIVETQTGIKVKDFIGKTHAELGFPPELINLWEKALQRVFETRQVDRIEFQLPGGIWIDWQLVPEIFNNHVNTVLAYARDITEIKKKEEEILNLNELLEIKVIERTIQLAQTNEDLLKTKEEVQKRYHELDNLYNLIDRINKTKNIEEIYKEVVLSLERTLSTYGAAILLYDNTGTMRYVYWKNISELYRKSIEEQAPWKTDGSEAMPIFYNEIRSSSISEEVKSIILNEGIESIFVFPLQFKSKFIGKLVLYYNAPHILKEEEKQIAYTIANHVAFALNKLKDEEELQNYKDHLEHLVSERTKKLEQLNNQLSKIIEKEKKTEDKIQTQFNFLRTLIDTIPNPIFIKDKRKVYTDCNVSFTKYFGENKNGIIGKTVRNFVPVEWAEKYEIEDEILLKTGGNSVSEGVFFDAEGNKKDVLMYKAAFNKKDGNAEGIVGIILDISERKKLETELEKSLRKEKDLNELKTRFISTASHEFRTPLTSILSSAELLELFGRKWSDDKYFEQIKIIIDEVKYLTEIITDVLTVSRIDTEKTEYYPCELNLYNFCIEIIHEIKSSFNGDFKINFGYNLSERVFFLDKRLLKQILINLLTNSVKYSYEKGIIDFHVKFEGECLIFLVKDSGMGIPKNDQPNLFDPFHRGKNVGNIQGTGLGLSIVKKSVELHKGEISFISKENAGTTFYVKIPMKHI